jgi:hypothetical protein
LAQVHAASLFPFYSASGRRVARIRFRAS